MTTETLLTPEQEFLNQIQALGVDRAFVHVELARLKIDPRYQRKLNMQRVRKYAGAYDPDLMGVLVCSVRPDGVFIIDGQHRYEVARLLGLHTIRCELRIGLTLEQEANIFYNLDTKRVALNSEDSFRALLTAKDKTALDIEKAVVDAGLVLATGGKMRGVRAYKTMLAIVDRYSVDRLRAVLRIIARAWDTLENPAPSAILEGLAFFLDKFPDVGENEVARILKLTDPITLTKEARAISGSMSWNTKHSMARAILNHYNHRRAVNRLDESVLGYGKDDENGETNHVAAVASAVE